MLARLKEADRNYYLATEEQLYLAHGRLHGRLIKGYCDVRDWQTALRLYQEFVARHQRTSNKMNSALPVMCYHQVVQCLQDCGQNEQLAQFIEAQRH